MGQAEVGSREDNPRLTRLTETQPMGYTTFQGVHYQDVGSRSWSWELNLSISVWDMGILATRQIVFITIVLLISCLYPLLLFENQTHVSGYLALATHQWLFGFIRICLLSFIPEGSEAFA